MAPSASTTAVVKRDRTHWLYLAVIAAATGGAATNWKRSVVLPIPGSATSDRNPRPVSIP